MNRIIYEDLEKIFIDKKINWEYLKRKTVLVTGAYGMLASYMIFMLIYLNEKHDYQINIVGIGRSEDKFKKKFGNYVNKPYFTTVISDINKLDISNYPSDYYIFSASITNPNHYADNPIELLSGNTIHIHNSLNHLKDKNVDGILFFSSTEVYGINSGIINEDDFGIINPLSIRNCYPESKRFGETLCINYYRQYNLPVSIVRPSHTYGPTMNLESDDRVFSDFVNGIVIDKELLIKGTGDTTRSFCYLSDATSGFFYILLNGRRGEAYNVSNTQEHYSILELANKICDTFSERKIKQAFADRNANEKYIESPNTDIIKYDTQKLEKLGWKPQVSVEEGFKRTVLSIEQRGLDEKD